MERKTPMPRGKGLARGKGLDRGTSQLARTPMKRTASKPPTGGQKRTYPTKVPKMGQRAATGPTAAGRTLTADRDGGLCVRCGTPLDGSLGYSDHHRQGRGSGGRQGDARAASNSPANRLSLCGSGTTGCHGLVTNPPAFGATMDEVRDQGFVVRRNGNLDPATVPVLTHRGWRLFGHDGTATPCEAPDIAA